MMPIEVKGFAWVGVGTADFARSRDFFTRVLGLEVSAEEGTTALLNVASGQQLEIFGGDSRGRRLNDPPTIAFEVDDVSAARDTLLAEGIEIIGEIGQWGGHEWLYFRTPDGHVFELKRSPRGADSQ
jgi:glyoxylase I family protein